MLRGRCLCVQALMSNVRFKPYATLTLKGCALLIAFIFPIDEYQTDTNNCPTRWDLSGNVRNILNTYAGDKCEIVFVSMGWEKR